MEHDQRNTANGNVASSPQLQGGCKNGLTPPNDINKIYYEGVSARSYTPLVASPFEGQSSCRDCGEPLSKCYLIPLYRAPWAGWTRLLANFAASFYRYSSSFVFGSAQLSLLASHI